MTITTATTPRTLVAGVGNIFFGDDGFGVEVVRQLALAPPPGVTVVDFGIRGVHLAYEMLAPVELVVIADCMSRGGTPGTLYVVSPETAVAPGVDDAHGMNLPAVFATVRAMAGALPRVRIVGCEPASLEPAVGLSPTVARTIPSAVELVRSVLADRNLVETL
jgi:hydrogenase maturation protease